MDFEVPYDSGVGARSDPEAVLRTAILHDDRPTFVSQVKDMLELNENPYMRRKLCPPDTFQWICAIGATNCATALLEGEAGLLVDLNKPFQSGTYPLHEGASGLYYDLVELFLHHGARTDVISTERFRFELFPLNAALLTLTHPFYPIDWSPEESIYKLVYSLCMPKMKEPLETIRLLAWSTKDVIEIFYDYAREGKLLEMATLLMVAKERVAPNPFLSKDGSFVDGSMTTRQIIKEKIWSSMDIEIQSSIDNDKRYKLKRMFEGERVAMISALRLLKLFERAGDAIESYRQSQLSNEGLVRDFAAILKEKGIVLKAKDIDLSYKNHKSIKIQEYMSPLGKIIQYINLRGLQRHAILPENHEAKTRSRPHALQVEPLKNWSAALHTGPPTSHSFRGYSSFASNEFMKVVQFRGETNATQRHLLPSKSRSLLSSLALSFMRGIRHV